MSDAAAESESNAGRKPVLAFALSVLALGLGQLYAGSVRRAIAALVIGHVAFAVAMALFVLPRCSPLAIALGAAIGIGTPVAVASDAARVARCGRPLWRNRWIETAVLVAYLVAVSLADDHLASLVRTRVAVPFRIPSEAMAPGLLVGDHFLVDPLTYEKRDPKRGEVVTFLIARDTNRKLFPADLRADLPTETFIKRIIGIPGDRVEVRGNEVWLNGQLVSAHPLDQTHRDGQGREFGIATEELPDRSYEVLRDREAPSQAPITIAADRYFVLGDNRSRSNDSRFWGTVARRDLIGPATHLYGSWLGAEIRWRRIGMCPR